MDESSYGRIENSGGSLPIQCSRRAFVRFIERWTIFGTNFRTPFILVRMRQKNALRSLFDPG